MTLSVMDDLAFTTNSFDCMKCSKLDTDLKTSKLENEELRKLVTAMKTQADKTGALLHKFTNNKKNMLLQKQTILNLEKQCKRAQSEAETAAKQLKQHLLEPSTLTKDEQTGLVNELQSHKAIIRQSNNKIASLDDELKKMKAEKVAAEKKCKTFERAQKTPSELQEKVTALTAEVTKLKKENASLKISRESTINNLADKKNKDIFKKLTDMTDHQKAMEDKMKEILETVRTPAAVSINAASAIPGRSCDNGFARPTKRSVRKSTGDDDYTPAKRIGRPPKRKVTPQKMDMSNGDLSKRKVTPQRMDMSNSDLSDFESVSRPAAVSKRTGQPLKKRGRPVGYSPKAKKIITKSKTLLSNTDTSDSDDVDLIGQLLEDSLNSETSKVIPNVVKTRPSKPELLDDATLVCDVLPCVSVTPEQFNIFTEQPTVEKKIQVTRRVAQTKTLPRLDVENMFDVMIMNPSISPISFRAIQPVPKPLIKTECAPESSASSLPAVEEDVGVATSVAPLDQSPKVTSVGKRAKDKLPRVEFKIISAGKKPTLTAEVELPDSSIQSIPNLITANSEPEPNVTKPPSNSPEESTASISTPTSPFLPIVIKNERKKFKTEPPGNVLTIKPTPSQQCVRPAPALTTIGNMLSRPNTGTSPDNQPELEITKIEKTADLQNEEPSDVCEELDVSSVEVEAAPLLHVAANTATLEEDAKPSRDKLASGVICEAPAEPPISTLDLDKERVLTDVNKQGIVKEESGIADVDDTVIVIIPELIVPELIVPELIVPEDTMLCAFEMDVDATSRSQSSQSEGQSDSDCKNSDQQRLKKMARLNKKLLIDASFEAPTGRRKASMSASESEDNTFVLPKRTRNSRSSTCKDTPEPLTKTLRNRKISISDHESSSEFKSPRKQKARKYTISSGASENEDVKVLRKRSVSITLPEKEVKKKKQRKPRTPCVPCALPLEVTTVTLDVGAVLTPVQLESPALESPPLELPGLENPTVLPSPNHNTKDEILESEIECDLELCIDDVSVVEEASPTQDDNNEDDIQVREDVDENQNKKDGLELPPSHMFVKSTSVPDLNLQPLDKPIVVPETRPAESTTSLVDKKASRKRKKRTAPSPTDIFDLFIPAESLPSLVFAPNDTELTIDTSDDELPESAPSSCAVSVAGDTQKPIVSVDLKLLNSLRSSTVPNTTPIDEEPVYHGTHEDYTHLSAQAKFVQQHFTELFRKNLCTSNPNVPYIVETILFNHKHHVLQNLEEKFVVVIRNEISVRNSIDPTETLPPIDVLVDLFDDVFSRLEASDYSYFKEGYWKKRVFLARMLHSIRNISRNYKDQYGSLLSFVVKLSLKWGELSHLRFYVINTVLSNRQGLVQGVLFDTLNSYSAELLIGCPHIGYNKDQNTLKEFDNLYLAGLEFYLRYSQIRYTPASKLTYMHQFAIEHHLMSSAVNAIVVKEEGEETKHCNHQGLMCLKLMLKSQGWQWLANTLLPLIFDTLAITSEYGICRLLEVTEALITSEIVCHRADMTLVKDKYLPTLTGLLWTAPTFEVKASIARCLLRLSPVNYATVPQQLLDWVNSLPPPFKEHHLYETVLSQILRLSQAAKNKPLC